MTRVTTTALRTEAVVGWNSKVGYRDSYGEELSAVAGEFGGNPAALCLHETNGNRAAMRRWARGHGYHVIGATPDDLDAYAIPNDVLSSSQILLRDDLEIRASGLIVVPVWWKGPKGKRIHGRAFPWVYTKIGDRWTIVIAVHMPWGWWKNLKAWRASLRELREFADDHPFADILVIPDANQPATVTRPWSIARTMRNMGGRVIATGLSVDYPWFRPGRQKGIPQPSIHGEKGPKGRSDHRSFAARLHWLRARAAV